MFLVRKSQSPSSLTQMSNVRCSLTETSFVLTRPSMPSSFLLVLYSRRRPLHLSHSSFMQAISSYGCLKFLVVHPPGVPSCCHARTVKAMMRMNTG
jgi:hypothetical protein